jgi:hypothetical protein
VVENTFSIFGIVLKIPQVIKVAVQLFSVFHANSTKTRHSSHTHQSFLSLYVTLEDEKRLREEIKMLRNLDLPLKKLLQADEATAVAPKALLK